MAKDDDKTRMYEIKQPKNVEGKGNKKKGKRSSDIDETKRVDGVKDKKVKKGKKEKKQKKHPKLRMFFKIFFILCILLFLIGVGVFAAIFFGDTWEMTEEDLIIKMQNSSTYDINGDLLHEIRGEENRKIIPLSEMGEYIPKAYVAIEDERFYEHSGIDLYRTAGAIVTYILNGGNSSFGGSTITQQLVKNLKEDDDDSIARKIREWSRAYKVEKMLSKKQILELYLNEIFVGGQQICGVESGAKYYFNKHAKDLSLAEAAFMAGINDSPNYYNPFGEEDKTEIINDKTKLVLGKMLEVKDENGETFITQEEYDEAIAEVDAGLKFEQGEFAGSSDLSFLEQDAINQVVEDLMEEYDIDREHAENRVYNNGYKIYTTQDSDIQDIMEKEFLKDKYLKDATTEKGKKNDEHSQAGMVIIDHSTGQVVAEVGGLGDDSPTYGTNRATSMANDGRQAGSSFKPLAAVAPALEEGVITAATVYDDSFTVFSTGFDPSNSTGYDGLITVRKAIEKSSNVVNVKILSNLGVNKSIDFLHEVGMTQFGGEEDEVLALALGGTASGTTPLLMAAAYAAIANGGEYIEPTFYTKVEDSDGNVILEAEQETRRVMSEGNAYVLSSILTSSVTGSQATAWQCAISGMDVAAKTGTTNEVKDRWLCGFTPYYTASVWFGFDEPEYIGIPNIYNPAMTLWSEVMDDVHEDLDGKRFEKPDNIVTAKICMDSGKVATDECTRVYSEVFVEGTVPDKCDGHKKVEICKETGKLATEYCPEKEEKIYLNTPEKEINPNWKTNAGKKYQEITETCDKHTEETMTANVVNVVGKTESEARTLLAQFAITVEYSTDNTQADGVVLAQSVAEGTLLKKGEAITITVNDIPEVVPPTEPTEPTEPTTPEEPTTPQEPTNTVPEEPVTSPANETVETNTVVNTNTVV